MKENSLELAATRTIRRVGAIYPQIIMSYRVENVGTGDEYIYIFHNYEYPIESFYEDCCETLENEFYSKDLYNVCFSYDDESYLKSLESIITQDLFDEISKNNNKNEKKYSFIWQLDSGKSFDKMTEFRKAKLLIA